MNPSTKISSSSSSVSTVDWSNFHSVTQLDIKFRDANSAVSSQIYGNAMNSVAVQITLQCIDKQGTPMQLEEADVSGMIYLCDFSRVPLQKFNFENMGESNQLAWIYGPNDNGYSNPLSYDGAGPTSPPEDDPSVVQTVFYIRWDPVGQYTPLSADFACGITINGTDYTTAQYLNPDFSSHIVVNSLALKSYTTDDFSSDREDVADVNVYYRIDGKIYYEATGDQDNYYLYFTDTNYKITSYITLENPGGYSDALAYFIVNNREVNIGSIWRMDETSRVMLYQEYPGVPGNYEIECDAMVINQRGPHKICITRISCPDKFNIEDWQDGPSNISIIDQYYNFAYIKISTHDSGNTIVLDNWASW